MDLTAFKNPRYRVDPGTLPPPENPDGPLAPDEAVVRARGYLPVYTNGFDQFGYDADGYDEFGVDVNGFSRDEHDAANRATQGDPLADVTLTIPPHAPTTLRGTVDRRRNNKGKPGNKGNKQGRRLAATDGTGRSLGEVWYDVFVWNENLPPHERLEDREILAHVARLFPGKVTGRTANDVTYQRWRYNNGRLVPAKKTLPEVKSWQYLRVPLPPVKGAAKRYTQTFLHRVTPKGRSLESWDITGTRPNRRTA